MASDLDDAVRQYAIFVDWPREGVAAKLADRLEYVVQMLPDTGSLGSIDGMDTQHVRTVEDMAAAASIFAKAFRAAPAIDPADAPHLWNENMLRTEHLLAAARGLWPHSDDSAGEDGDDDRMLLPASVAQLHQDAVQPLTTLVGHVNAQEEGSSARTAAMQALQRGVAKAQAAARANAVLAAHKHDLSSSFSLILGGVQGINLPLWHALEPGDPSFAVPDEMHACKNAFDTASRRCILFLRSYDRRFRTNGKHFNEYKNIMLAHHLNVGTGKATPFGPVHILQPSADKIERKVQALARCGTAAVPKVYRKAFELKCDIETYLTKALRLADWDFDSEAGPQLEYDFILRAIEALVHLNVRLIPTVYTKKCYPLTWHTRSWHLMGAEGHLPRLMLEMHAVGALSARGTEQMQFILRQLGLRTTRSGSINTKDNASVQALIKYIRSNAWRWSVPAMKTAAREAKMAGDKNRARLKDVVTVAAQKAVTEVFRLLDLPPSSPPPEVTAAGGAAADADAEAAPAQLREQLKWRTDLETCKLELQGKGRAPPSGEFVLPVSDKKANLKVADIKDLYASMVARIDHYVPPKKKMLRLDMEDALCREKIGSEPDVTSDSPPAGSGSADGGAPDSGSGTNEDPADWVLRTAEPWFASRENWWIAANDANPTAEVCREAQKTLMWGGHGDEDDELNEIGDDAQWRVGDAVVEAGDAEAQLEAEQPRSLHATGGEEEIAGELAGDVDPATMDTSGPDSAVVQDEEEAEMMRQEEMEEYDKEHAGGEDSEDSDADGGEAE